MTDDIDYQVAYLREKMARRRAEVMMQDRTRDLFQTNEELQAINQKLVDREKQLVASEKLRALGALSAGVAHEINNPLAYIMSNLKSLEKYFSSLVAMQENSISTSHSQNEEFHYIKSDAVDIFIEVDQGLRRIKDIVGNLNQFSRTNNKERVNTDVNNAIKTALKILENETKNKVEIELHLKNVPSIFCNENELGQVFLNIIFNAVQAIPERGCIIIRSWVESQRVYVSIKDNGIGIPADKLDTIFEPFYTSKPVGVGTGLGLSVSFGIVRNLGGEINVESELGSYTCFTLALPLDQRTSRA